MIVLLLILSLFLFEIIKAENEFPGGITPTWDGINYQIQIELTENGIRISHGIIIPKGYNFCTCKGKDGLDYSKASPRCINNGYCLALESDGWTYEWIKNHVGQLVIDQGIAKITTKLISAQEGRALFDDLTIEDSGVVISEEYSMDQVRNIGSKNSATGAFDVTLTGCFIAPSEISGFHAHCGEQHTYEVFVDVLEDTFGNAVACIVEHRIGIGADGKGVVKTHFYIPENADVAFVTMFMEGLQLASDPLGFYLTSYHFCNEKNNTIVGIQNSRESITKEPKSGHYKITAVALENGAHSSGKVEIDSIVNYIEMQKTEQILDITKPSESFIIDYDEKDYPIQLGAITQGVKMVISQYTDAFVLVTYDAKKGDYIVRDTNNNPVLSIRRTNKDGTTQIIPFNEVIWEDLSDNKKYTQYLPNHVQENVFRLYKMTFKGTQGFKSTDEFSLELKDLLELSIAGRRRALINGKDICGSRTFKTSALFHVNIEAEIDIVGDFDYGIFFLGLGIVSFIILLTIIIVLAAIVLVGFYCYIK